MRDNINKVSQRGERLDSLQDKTDNLAVSAQGFRRGANRVRKQMWWKVSLQSRKLFFSKLTSSVGYEDENVSHCRYHYLVGCYHCSSWYVDSKFPTFEIYNANILDSGCNPP